MELSVNDTFSNIFSMIEWTNDFFIKFVSKIGWHMSKIWSMWSCNIIFVRVEQWSDKFI